MNRYIACGVSFALFGCSQAGTPSPGQPDADSHGPDAPLVDARDVDAPAKLTMLECYAQMFVNQTTPELDYDQFSPTINSTCAGTNHQNITGVESVNIKKFQRQGIDTNEAILAGSLKLGRLEIARLDNDRNFPERGVFTLERG